jgi:Homeodomain-like domain
VTGRRRWGEAPRPAGRPPLDPRVRAVVFRLHAEDPSLGVRAIAARVEAETGVSVSRETVRKLLRSAETQALAGRRVGYVADRAGVGVMGQAGASVAAEPAWRAAWRAREMSPEDHAAFDEYVRAPASTWFWVPRPSPEVWWTFP